MKKAENLLNTAITLMVEALALLDEADEKFAAAHLQQAISIAAHEPIPSYEHHAESH